MILSNGFQKFHALFKKYSTFPNIVCLNKRDLGKPLLADRYNRLAPVFRIQPVEEPERSV